MQKVLYNIERVFKATTEELYALENSMELVTLGKNEFFLKEGEICRSIGFLEKGSMRLFYESQDREVCNDFFFENSLIGSLASFLSETPSIVNIAAIEPCELLLWNFEQVNELSQKYPAISRLTKVLIQEHLLRSERREADLLKNSPEDRFKNLIQIHPKIFKRIPLRYVASYLAITPETLSRYRARFMV